MEQDKRKYSDKAPFNMDDLDNGFSDAIMPRRTVTAKGSSKFNATSPYASLSPLPVDTKARREEECVQ